MHGDSRRSLASLLTPLRVTHKDGSTGHRHRSRYSVFIFVQAETLNPSYCSNSFKIKLLLALNIFLNKVFKLKHTKLTVYLKQKLNLRAILNY